MSGIVKFIESSPVGFVAFQSSRIGWAGGEGSMSINLILNDQTTSSCLLLAQELRQHGLAPDQGR